MDIRVEAKPIQEVECDAMVVVGFEGQPPQGAAADQIKDLYDSGEFSGKSLEISVLHRPNGLKAKRLVLAGGGKRDRFDSAELRKISGAALRSLKPKGVRGIALALDDPFRAPEFAAAAVEGAMLADLEADRYKTDPKKNEKQVAWFAVLGASESAVSRGRVVAESQNFTRNLANEPSNVLTPTQLAERAREMAAQQGLECEVLDQDRMRQLGMGALLGVAQGSAEPPALIIVRYKPANPSTQDHLGLVGKGVTFDTGGISIKPAEGMEKMRYDMAGGAAVLGAMRAIAQLKPSVRVTALVPAVENMPGSRAQRPGDIVTTLNGKTVEVLNTDAEGRLILIDTLTYAQRLGCTHLVDAATLTGAIVVALGAVNAGVFTNNDAFAAKLMTAAKTEGEKMWRMPMDEEYKEALKTPFADLQNIGGRPAGSVTAAMFLRDFVGDTPWIHLDIAGTAWLDDPKPYMAKGASGIGVRTFVQLAESW
ncbi:MAG: leucyl aminopeptidase [Acidobacteriia bacterium]|nr:leucyl aminopeptidase [Terriglobia bacterium]